MEPVHLRVDHGGARQYLAKKYYDIQKNKEGYNAIIKRLQESPTAKDVTDGDALNAALDQLNDPRIQASSMSFAKEPIDAKIIAEIPFRYASEAVTIILSQVKGATKWPPALDIARFEDDKKAFEEMAEQAQRKTKTERSRRRPSSGPTPWSAASEPSSKRRRWPTRAITKPP